MPSTCCPLLPLQLAPPPLQSSRLQCQLDQMLQAVSVMKPGGFPAALKVVASQNVCLSGAHGGMELPDLWGFMITLSSLNYSSGWTW